LRYGLIPIADTLNIGRFDFRIQASPIVFTIAVKNGEDDYKIQLLSNYTFQRLAQDLSTKFNLGTYKIKDISYLVHGKHVGDTEYIFDLDFVRERFTGYNNYVLPDPTDEYPRIVEIGDIRYTEGPVFDDYLEKY